MPTTSIQLYTMRDPLASDLAGTLARLAEVGFTHAEPFGIEHRPDEMAAALRAAGLLAPSAHASLLSAGEPARVFEAAATIGVGIVVDPFHPRENWIDEADVLRTADRLASLAEAAEEYGLRVGYHNHEFELEQRIHGEPALERLARALGDLGAAGEKVLLEVDTYWAEVGGVNAPALLERLGERVALIHVKDGPVSKDTRLQVPAGQGSVDVAGVLAAAPSAIRVIEFDDYAGDIFDGVAQSLAYVRQIDG